MHTKAEVIKLKEVKAGELVQSLPYLGSWAERIERSGSSYGLKGAQHGVYGQPVTVMLQDGTAFPEELLDADVIRITVID